jgi:signal peptidase II
VRAALEERRGLAALVVALIALDQWTKALVAARLRVHESVEVVAGWVDLTHLRNRGGAFGFLSDAELPAQPLWFGLVGLAATAAIVWYSLRTPREERLVQTALALVLGGAIGNLIDRARLGYVVDFVDVYWGRHHWPAFNVADSAITIGVSLLVLDMLRRPDPEPVADSASSAATPGAPEADKRSQGRVAAAAE